MNWTRRHDVINLAPSTLLRTMIVVVRYVRVTETACGLIGHEIRPALLSLLTHGSYLCLLQDPSGTSVPLLVAVAQSNNTTLARCGSICSDCLAWYSFGWRSSYLDFWTLRPTWITEHGKVATLVLNRVKRILAKYQDDYLSPVISPAISSLYLFLNNRLFKPFS